jgi:hypothetical protein
MTQLQTKIKDYVVEFKPSNRGESTRPSMYVTKEFAMTVLAARKDRSAKDIIVFDEEGNFRESIEKSDITRVRKADEKEAESRNTVGPMVCEYGTRHPHLGNRGFQDCNCYQRFQVESFTFEKIIKKLFPAVKHSMQITQEMQFAVDRHVKSLKTK